MKTTEALAVDPNLAKLSSAERTKLARAFESAEFGDGDHLIRRNEFGDAAFLITDGQVRIGDSDRVLGPGTLVGLVALVDFEPRSVDVVAVGAVKAARLTREKFAALAESAPNVGVAVRLAMGAQLARDFRSIEAQTMAMLEGKVKVKGAKAKVHDYDVVVIGGGPVGLAYATWVRRQRPDTRVAVIERKAVPGYKIGEATLGGTIRALESLGLSRPVMRRLLANKWGMGFWWTGEGDPDVNTHVDVGGIDETYQVERRMMEMALQKTTERDGVDIFRNHLVRIKESTIETADGNELVCEGPNGEEVRFRAPVVCDASGSASVIPRALGIYRKNVDSFQSNAYFAYFKGKSTPDVPDWDFGVSRHLCFPAGWVWFISVCSWEKASDDSLQAMIDHLLDFQGTENDFPTRDELSAKFDAPYENIMSIGIVPRADLDVDKGSGVEEKFNTYLKEYPGIGRVLSHFELQEKHYEDHATYAGFQKMSHDCERFTGDGWLVVGDAAAFTNPLYTPGLNYGFGTAYMAAQATVNALNRRDYSARAFATHEEYMKDIFTALLRENEMFYRAFRHPDMMERALMTKFFFGTVDRLAARPGASADPYTPQEPYIFDLLNPRFTSVVNRVVDIQRADEEAGVDPAKTAKAVRGVIDPFFADLAQMPAVRDAHYGRFFTHYTDDLKRSPKKNKSLGRTVTWHCPTCKTFVSIRQDRCHVCGTKGDIGLKKKLIRKKLPGPKA